MQEGISRRDFIKGSVATALALKFGMLPDSATASESKYRGMGKLRGGAESAKTIYDQGVQIGTTEAQALLNEYQITIGDGGIWFNLERQPHLDGHGKIGGFKIEVGGGSSNDTKFVYIGNVADTLVLMALNADNTVDVAEVSPSQEHGLEATLTPNIRDEYTAQMLDLYDEFERNR